MSEVFIAFLNYLDQADQPYPWQLLGTDFTDTLAESDSPGMLSELDEELDEHSARFLAHLDHLFPRSLQFKTLHNRLQGWLPLELCQDILRACQAQLHEGLDVADRLRRVLEDLLPQWSAADLDILLRSYGSALRGDMGTALPDGSGQSWEELSPLVQGQYLAAIANFCLTELESEI